MEARDSPLPLWERVALRVSEGSGEGLRWAHQKAPRLIGLILRCEAQSKAKGRASKDEAAPALRGSLRSHLRVRADHVPYLVSPLAAHPHNPL